MFMVSANLMFFVVPYVFLKLHVIDALFQLDEISYSFSEVITDFSFLLLINFRSGEFQFQGETIDIPQSLDPFECVESNQKTLSSIKQKTNFCLFNQVY